MVGGIGLAFLLSPLTPVGEARLADPSTGFDFDAVVLLAGALAAVVVVVALGLLPAIVSTRDQHAGRMTKVARPSRVVALLAQAGAPPSALIGVRHGLERGRGRDAVPVGAALVGSVVAVSAICATVVFGASLTHLTGTPALYGEPFDLAFLTTAPYSPIQLGQLAAVFELNGAISAATVTRGEDVRTDGRSVDALAGQGSLNQAERPMPTEVTIWSTVLKVSVSYSSNSMPFAASAKMSLSMSVDQRRTWVWSALFPPPRPYISS